MRTEIYEQIHNARHACLPLHLAVMHGSFEGSIELILNVNPSQVKEIDPVTGLYPFMLAASEGQNVNIIFNLLLMYPPLAYSSESADAMQNLSKGIQSICL